MDSGSNFAHGFKFCSKPGLRVCGVYATLSSGEWWAGGPGSPCCQSLSKWPYLLYANIMRDHLNAPRDQPFITSDTHMYSRAMISQMDSLM